MGSWGSHINTLCILCILVSCFRACMMGICTFGNTCVGGTCCASNSRQCFERCVVRYDDSGSGAVLGENFPRKFVGNLPRNRSRVALCSARCVPGSRGDIYVCPRCMDMGFCRRTCCCMVCEKSQGFGLLLCTLRYDGEYVRLFGSGQGAQIYRSRLDSCRK